MTPILVPSSCVGKKIIDKLKSINLISGFCILSFIPTQNVENEQKNIMKFDIGKACLAWKLLKNINNIEYTTPPPIPAVVAANDNNIIIINWKISLVANGNKFLWMQISFLQIKLVWHNKFLLQFYFID